MDKSFSRVLFLTLGGVFGCLAGICLGIIVFSGLILNAALEESPAASPSLSDPGSQEDREGIRQPTLAPLPPPENGAGASPAPAGPQQPISPLPPPGGGAAEGPGSTGPQPDSPLPPSEVQPVSCNCSGDIYNCENFGSWPQAQGCFQYCVSTGVGDVHLLDENGDGLVCEALR